MDTCCSGRRVCRDESYGHGEAPPGTRPLTKAGTFFRNVGEPMQVPRVASHDPEPVPCTGADWVAKGQDAPARGLEHEGTYKILNLRPRSRLALPVSTQLVQAILQWDHCLSAPFRARNSLRGLSRFRSPASGGHQMSDGPGRRMSNMAWAVERSVAKALIMPERAAPMTDRAFSVAAASPIESFV